MWYNKVYSNQGKHQQKGNYYHERSYLEYHLFYRRTCGCGCTGFRNVARRVSAQGKRKDFPFPAQTITYQKEKKKMTKYAVVIYPNKIQKHHTELNFIIRSKISTNLEKMKEYYADQKAKHGSINNVHLVTIQKANELKRRWAEILFERDKKMLAEYKAQYPSKMFRTTYDRI